MKSLEKLPQIFLTFCSAIFPRVSHICGCREDWSEWLWLSARVWEKLASMKFTDSFTPLHNRSALQKHSASALYAIFLLCVLLFFGTFFGVALLRNSNRWNWFKGFLMNANEAANVLSHNNRLKPHTIILENLCSSPLVKRETIDRKSLKVPFLVSISIEL